MCSRCSTRSGPTTRPGSAANAGGVAELAVLTVIAAQVARVVELHRQLADRADREAQVRLAREVLAAVVDVHPGRAVSRR